MLALARVMMTRPRLLMIDELALGLAPKTVDRLMGIVRRVNAEGTTVILVEQSVNRAMHLAGRAFFLERGEVRFDGPTAELLERSDLLRPVFLAEAGTGLAEAPCVDSGGSCWSRGSSSGSTTACWPSDWCSSTRPTGSSISPRDSSAWWPPSSWSSAPKASTSTTGSRWCWPSAWPRPWAR